MLNSTMPLWAAVAAKNSGEVAICFTVFSTGLAGA